MSAQPAAVLEFEPEAHLYKLQGQPVPSVSRILEPFNNLEHVDPQLLAVSARFGRIVHEACRLSFLGQLDRDALAPIVLAYVDQFEKWQRESGALVIASEVQVWHPEHRYAGTLDTLARIARRRSSSLALVDIKSGVIPATVGPQTMAYARALERSRGQKVAERYVLQLGEKRYRFERLTSPANDVRDWNRFASALTCYRWHEELRGAQV